MLQVTIAVNRERTKGPHEFLKDLPRLLRAAETWRLEVREPGSATVVSTAHVTALPSAPKFVISEADATSVSVRQIDAATWTDDQQKLALGYVAYLFMTALNEYANKITILY